MLQTYILLGIGAYLGMSAARLHTFKDAGILGIVKGVILGFVLWPVGLGIMSYVSLADKREVHL